MDDVKKVTTEATATNEVVTAPARKSTPDAHDFMHAAYHARKNPDRTPSTPMAGG